MRITYDETVDCGYIYMGEGRRRTRPVKHQTMEVKTAPKGIFGQLNVDVTPEGRVLGIEVLNVTLTMPELIEAYKKQERDDHDSTRLRRSKLD
jgi:uncharacterized protein YuzE